MRFGKIRFVKNGNALALDTQDKRAISTAVRALQYQHRTQISGFAARRALREGRSLVQTEIRDLFIYDHRGRVVTGYGCYPRLKSLFESSGWSVEFVDETEPPDVDEDRDPDYMSPYALKQVGEQFQGDQRERFLDLISQERAFGVAPTGYGKTWLIRMICQIFERAKIDIVARRSQLVHVDIYDALCGACVSVGKVGGGKQDTSQRVACVTADSLHHRPFDADILLVDEPQELCADKYMEQLANYDRCRRMYTFSATDERDDGLHARLEPLFGLPIFRIPFQEAVDMGRIVPAHILWRTVSLDHDPASGVPTGDYVEAARANFWRNEARNQIIADDARSYGDDEQVLIICDKTDHVMQLRRFLPDFTPVYGAESVEAERLARYMDEGCLTNEDILPTKKRREQLQRQFASGELKKVIVTDIWNVGVNFPNLAVLILASPGNDNAMKQRLGRGVRRAEGKKYVICHDYYDTWNENVKRKSKGRFKLYKTEGHTQFRIDSLGNLQEADRL